MPFPLAFSIWRARGMSKENVSCYDYAMNEKRVAKISDLAGNLGLIFFVSVFLEPLLKGGADTKALILGLSFAFFSWFASLFLLSWSYGFHIIILYVRRRHTYRNLPDRFVREKIIWPKRLKSIFSWPRSVSWSSLLFCFGERIGNQFFKIGK